MIKNQGGGGGCKWVGGGTSVPLLYRQFYIIDQTWCHTIAENV